MEFKTNPTVSVLFSLWNPEEPRMKGVYKLEERNIKYDLIKVHHIKTVDDCKQGGWYHQTRAIDGMLHRLLNRWCKHWHTNTKRYIKYNSVMRFHRFDYITYETEIGLMSEAPQVIHHDSAYAFFDYIGYDYKDHSMKNLDTLILKKSRGTQNEVK